MSFFLSPSEGMHLRLSRSPHSYLQLLHLAVDVQAVLEGRHDAWRAAVRTRLEETHTQKLTQK